MSNWNHGLHWNRKYELLVQFWQQHGHTKVTPEMDPALAKWAARQRFFDLFLGQVQVDLLNRIDFPWDWEYQTTIGTTVTTGVSVATTATENESAPSFAANNTTDETSDKKPSPVQEPLEMADGRQGSSNDGPNNETAPMVSSARTNFMPPNNSAPKEQPNGNLISRAASLPQNNNDLIDPGVETNNDALNARDTPDIPVPDVTYKQVHGDCKVYSADPQLESWLNGKLINLGEGMQFLPENRSDWNKKLDKLKDYKKQFGHVDVPRCKALNGIPLGHWVTYLRTVYKEGKLEKEWVNALNNLDFVWVPKRGPKRKHSVCVPKRGPKRKHSDLGNRPARKRVRKRRNPTWDDYFASLKEFREIFGHCLVPSNNKDDPKLADWVELQRKHYRYGNLEEEQKEALDEVGFVWKVEPNRGSNAN